jgi:hypothetical protein
MQDTRAIDAPLLDASLSKRLESRPPAALFFVPPNLPPRTLFERPWKQASKNAQW